MKNRELRNSLKQAIANIGRVILNSSRQPSSGGGGRAGSAKRGGNRARARGGASGSEGRSSRTSCTDGQQWRQQEQGTRILSGLGPAKKKPKSPTHLHKRRFEISSSKQPAGDRQNDTAGRDTQVEKDVVKGDNGDTAVAASSSSAVSDTSNDEEGLSDSASSSDSVSEDYEDENEESDGNSDYEDSDDGYLPRASPINLEPSFFQRARTGTESSLEDGNRQRTGSQGLSTQISGAGAESGSRRGAFANSDAPGARRPSPASPVLPVSGGGVSKRKDKASIQSELDGIREHLVDLLRQMAASASADSTENGAVTATITPTTIAKLELSEGLSEATSPPLLAAVRDRSASLSPVSFLPVHRRQRTDSKMDIPDFRSGIGLDIVEGEAVSAPSGSPTLSAALRLASDQSDDLKAQVLHLQQQVEEQALKFSVSQADSSFLTNVLAQKDKILHECQLLLIELDTRHQGLVAHATKLEAKLKARDERIAELLKREREAQARATKAEKRAAAAMVRKQTDGRGGSSGDGNDSGGGGGAVGVAAHSPKTAVSRSSAAAEAGGANAVSKGFSPATAPLTPLSPFSPMAASPGAAHRGMSGVPSPSYHILMGKLARLQIQLREEKSPMPGWSVARLARSREGSSSSSRRNRRGGGGGARELSPPRFEHVQTLEL